MRTLSKWGVKAIIYTYIEKNQSLPSSLMFRPGGVREPDAGDGGGGGTDPGVDEERGVVEDAPEGDSFREDDGPLKRAMASS